MLSSTPHLAVVYRSALISDLKIIGHSMMERERESGNVKFVKHNIMLTSKTKNI